MKQIHIFDVDHTITRHSTGHLYVKTAISLKKAHWTVMPELSFIYLRYRSGLLKPSHIDHDMPKLEGISRTTLVEIADQCFIEQIKPDIFEDAYKYISELRKEGVDLALATSSFDIIVQPLAEYLGIPHVLASSVEFVDGLCTGRFLETPVFSEEKRNKVLDFLSGLSISPENCHFYSDSIYDKPLMEAVGTPVVVNPDFMLSRHARKVDWPILKWN